MRVDKTKWENRKLGDIATYINGYAFKPTQWKDSGIPIIRIQNLNNSLASYNFFDGDGIPEKYIVKNGDVLISWSASLGVYEWMNNTAYLNQHIFKVVFDKIQVDKSYFKHAVSSRLYDMANRVHGVTMQHIVKKDFDNISFPLPPFHIQLTIASELDAVQEMIDGYKAQLADLDELAKSIYHSYIDNKNFTYVKFESICSKMMSGPFGTMLHKSDYVDTSGIPQINPQDIKGGVVVKDNIKFINPIKLNELKRFLLKENDIIIARRGDLSKCTIIKKEHINWLCGTGSCLVRITKVLPSIFYYWFTSDHIQTILNENVIGTTMPNLNKKKLQETLIPVPPLHLQQQFATQIEAIEKQKELVSQQLADAQTLFDSRMQYYFE